GFALALRHFYRSDLVPESAGLLRCSGLLLGAQGVGVLLLAADLIALGEILRSYAHVIVVEGVPQAVVHHAVDQLAVAHALAGTGVRQQMGGQAHGLLAAGDHDLRIAAADGLRSKMDRLESGAADLVDVQCRHAVRQATMNGRLARRVLTAPRS